MGNAGLGKRIQMFRKQCQLTQAELAEKMGVSRSTVSMWEYGSNEPSLDTLDKLASIFGVHVSRLTQDETTLREHISGRAWEQANGNFDEAIRWQEVYDEFGAPIDMKQEDKDRLEALHQNPRLGLLFDRAKNLKESDIQFMERFVDAVLKERDGD